MQVTIALHPAKLARETAQTVETAQAANLRTAQRAAALPQPTRQPLKKVRWPPHLKTQCPARPSLQMNRGLSQMELKTAQAKAKRASQYSKRPK